jgi:site-specific DNA-methyltransferase (adenine-specific)
VLDPFAGAGTTLLAAQAEGAHGIGIEIDPIYVAAAQARLAAALAASPAVPRLSGSRSPLEGRDRYP